jgi:acyl-CoA synthetase (NDP forming)
LTSGEHPPETKALLDEEGHGAPLLRGASEAFRALGAVALWQRRRATRLEMGPWRSAWTATAQDRTAFGLDAPALAAASPPIIRTLPERESLDLLRSAGLAVTPAIAVRDAEAAVEAARPLGGHAVVLKVDAVELPHKSDLGLVHLGACGDDEVRAAAEGLLATAARHGIAARGLLVEPMADSGIELIVGMRRDPSFGPCVMVGLGGVFTEVLDDVAIRLAPVTPAVASSMLDDLRGARILQGVRGGVSIDRGAVSSLIVDLSALAVQRADLLEVDLNPVIASAEGAVAVDALVVLGAPSVEGMVDG